MKMIPSFDPTSAASRTFDPQVSNPCGRIYLFNESAIGLTLTFQDGSVAGLPPYYFRSYPITKPGMVIWKQNYTIATGASPLSVVIGEAYESAEAKNVHWTEGPLNRQTSIGNSIPVNTAVTTLNNDGNAVNTPVIEATQSGSAGSNLLIDNSGNLTLKQWVASTLTTLFQVVANASTCVLIGATGKLAEVIGGLKVDQNLTVVGSSSLDNATITTDGAGNISAVKNIISSGNVRLAGGKIGVTVDGDVIDASGTVDTYLKTRSAGGNVIFQVPNGTTQFSVGSGGPTIASGNHLTFGTGDTLSQTHAFSGTGTVTVSHGMNGTPFMVAVTAHVSGSQTQGYDSENATTVHITSGAGLAWKAIGFLG